MAAGQGFSITALMGILMVVGIAVSNGILLVDDANRRFMDGAEKLDAVVAAARSRFVPIAMTSLATVIGLLPTAIGLETGTEANQPLALAVVGGLTSSTILSLFLVPVMFMLFAKRSVATDELDAPTHTPEAPQARATGTRVIERLLVALDASPRAPGVLAAAAEIAARFGATLTPLRVLAIPPDFPPAAHVDTGDELPAFLLREAENQLRALVATLPAGGLVNDAGGSPRARLADDPGGRGRAGRRPHRHRKSRLPRSGSSPGYHRRKGRELRAPERARRARSRGDRGKRHDHVVAVPRRRLGAAHARRRRARAGAETFPPRCI